MRHIFLIIAGAYVVLSCSGCSHITMLRTEELRRIQHHVDSLNTELNTAQQDILKHEKTNQKLLRQIRADQQIKFKEMNQRITALQKEVYESQQRLTSIDEKTRDIKKSWQEKAREDSLARAMEKGKQDQLYQLAYEDFMAGRYELAVDGFKDLITTFPDSKKSELARYWIAESYYARKQPQEAKEAYKHYLQKYPDGEKTAVALYKLGIVYGKVDNTKARSLVWKKLMEKYPESAEAEKVKKELQ
jgi:tol-pal system protein YbgF